MSASLPLLVQAQSEWYILTTSGQYLADHRVVYARHHRWWPTRLASLLRVLGWILSQALQDKDSVLPYHEYPVLRGKGWDRQGNKQKGNQCSGFS
jgi:hypothetical protein